MRRLHEDQMIKTKRTLLTLTLATLTLLACQERKRYPDISVGWHSPDFSVVFGRLLRIPLPAPDPGSPTPPPAWVLKFDQGGPYNGEIALTPPERLVGYSGGEPVEVHGHFLNQSTN